MCIRDRKKASETLALLELPWVKAHHATLGNKRADCLAKVATEKREIKVSLTVTMTAIKSDIQTISTGNSVLCCVLFMCTLYVTS